MLLAMAQRSVAIAKSAVMIRIQLYLSLFATFDVTRFLRYVALRYHPFKVLTINFGEHTG